MKNYFDLTGQVAVVVGCMNGLGPFMAKALANQGSHIVLVGADKKAMDAEALELRLNYGARVLVVCGDVNDKALADETVRNVLRQYGRLDIVLNNTDTDVFVSTIMENAMNPAKYGRVIYVTPLADMSMTPARRSDAEGITINTICAADFNPKTDKGALSTSVVCLASPNSKYVNGAVIPVG